MGFSPKTIYSGLPRFMETSICMYPLGIKHDHRKIPKWRFSRKSIAEVGEVFPCHVWFPAPGASSRGRNRIPLGSHWPVLGPSQRPAPPVIIKRFADIPEQFEDFPIRKAPCLLGISQQCGWLPYRVLVSVGFKPQLVEGGAHEAWFLGSYAMSFGLWLACDDLLLFHIVTFC